MKPRSKRNRKRPRSERDALQENFEYKTQVHRVELDGQTLSLETARWIRMVEPYPYTFSTFAKARWVGRTVLDVYSTEFGSYPRSYYENAITQGRILVSDQVVSLDYIIQGKDVLSHTVHRHEPGVAVTYDKPPYLHVIQNTSDVVAVDKPGTLPIHACGGYHIQSLMNLLEPQFGKLYTIHRLDRLTSGLVILGKTSAIAQQWGKSIMHRNCQKVYLARVQGMFPLNCPRKIPMLSKEISHPENGEWTKAESSEVPFPDTVLAARNRHAHVYWITNGQGAVQTQVSLQEVFEKQQNEQAAFLCESGQPNVTWLHFACPTRISNPKDGVCEAGTFDDLEETAYLKTVKPAETSFAVMRYDQNSDSTLVVCRPKTGRTHQIRLHLQYLGHPIANDPNYGGEIWYRNEKGQKACQVAQERLDSIAASNRDTVLQSGTASIGPSTATIDVPATEDEIQLAISTAVRQETEGIHDFIKRTCIWCARSRNTVGGTPRDMLEFLIRSQGIWLHAWHYKFNGDKNEGTETASFQAPMPKWAAFSNLNE